MVHGERTLLDPVNLALTYLLLGDAYLLRAQLSQNLEMHKTSREECGSQIWRNIHGFDPFCPWIEAPTKRDCAKVGSHFSLSLTFTLHSLKR